MNDKKIAALGKRAASKASTDTIARYHQVARAVTSYLLAQRVGDVVRRRLGLVETPSVVESRSSVVAEYLRRRRQELAGGGK